MNTIAVDGKAYQAPSGWHELSPEQLIMWMKICAKRNINPKMALRLAVIFFYGIPKEKFFQLNKVQELQLLDTLDFLVQENKLISWVIPSFSIKGVEYLGASDRLSTSTIKEFRATELLYSAYLIKRDQLMLDQLIAAIYRPTGDNHPDNDLRVPLTDLGIDVRAVAMAKLDPATRQAILFNYEGCRAYVLSRYPTIFPTGEGKGHQLAELEPMIKTAAGGKFGSFNETLTTGLYLFLDHIRDELTEIERIKSTNRK